MIHHLSHIAWALWLAVPVLATVLAAVWIWWRNRPPRRPTLTETLDEHAGYLACLGAAVSAGVSQRRPAVGAADVAANGSGRDCR